MMTQRELRKYYQDRAALRITEETLAGIREYASAGGGDYGRDIAMLESSACEQAAALYAREAEVLSTLESVEDICRRTELRMHFCRGLEWKEIAGILGTTEKAVNGRCCRAMSGVIPK